MLKLNASYSKKVPAEGEYSSQSYHCSMEVELSDKLEPGDLQAKIHETFALVRDAVETELHGPVAKPAAQAPQVLVGQGQAKATNRQIKYLLDLANERGVTLSRLNATIQQDYGVESVYKLNRFQASQLVDRLKKADAKAAA